MRIGQEVRIKQVIEDDINEITTYRGG